jgi:uncharacterized protein
MREADIPICIERDRWMMNVLKAVKTLNPPDWWIGAGFVRNKIWDTLNGINRTPLSDIDVVFFDTNDLSESKEKDYQVRLEKVFPTGKWSVTNQARMSAINSDPEYSSSLDAISHWPETATAIAVTLDSCNHIVFKATHGCADLLNMKVRPTPTFTKKMEAFNERRVEKNWIAIWPNLKFD